MTKFILHGGNSSTINKENDNFFKEITKDLTSKTHVLLVYFAREEADVQACYEQDKSRISSLSENKDLEFEIANEDKLEQQIKNSDIIYLRGGTTKWLVEKLSKASNLKSLIKDKVVVGSSAGVYVLCKHYWENDENALGDGLALFNLKALCHYEPSEHSEVLQKLRQYGENLPIIALPNYQMILFFR